MRTGIRYITTALAAGAAACAIAAAPVAAADPGTGQPAVVTTATGGDVVPAGHGYGGFHGYGGGFHGYGGFHDYPRGFYGVPLWQPWLPWV